MSKWGSKRDKRRVARPATPTKAYPAIRRKIFASVRLSNKVIQIRHEQLKSWDELSRELGGVNVGTLINVMKGNRKPTNKLIDKLNRIYGSKIPYREIKALVPPCRCCGGIHDPHVSRSSCPSRKPRVYRHIADMPTAVLAWKIRNREEIDVGPSGL